MVRMGWRKANSRKHEVKMFEPWKIKRRRRRSTQCTLTHHNSQVCGHSRSMPASDGFKTTRLHKGRGLNHWAPSPSSPPSSLITLFFHEKPFSWQLLHRIAPFWDSFSYALLILVFSPLNALLIFGHGTLSILTSSILFCSMYLSRHVTNMCQIKRTLVCHVHHISWLIYI